MPGATSWRTIRQDGFTMPAEWEEQRAVLLSWPLNPATWEDRREALEKTYAGFAAAISQFEDVKIDCVASEQPRIMKLLSGAGADPARIELLDVPTDDAWCRDHGPVCLVNRADGRRILNHYIYNAWGGKFPPWDRDAAVPEHVAALLGYERRPVPMICEGGALETNGRGLLMTTESVMLNPNRNATMSRAQIGDMLTESLGMDEILWLKGGLFCDDTDGHIDTLARLAPDDTILYGEGDEALLIELQTLRTAEGKPYRLVAMPPYHVNFLIMNGAVLVPFYENTEDNERARKALESVFPEREIVGIDCRILLTQNGSLHCSTMQFPAIDTEK